MEALRLSFLREYTDFIVRSPVFCQGVETAPSCLTNIIVQKGNSLKSHSNTTCVPAVLIVQAVKLGRLIKVLCNSLLFQH